MEVKFDYKVWGVGVKTKMDTVYMKRCGDRNLDMAGVLASGAEV
jgi:hypothetical protein